MATLHLIWAHWLRLNRKFLYVAMGFALIATTKYERNFDYVIYGQVITM
jgi:hypothetical protein